MNVLIPLTICADGILDILLIAMPSSVEDYQVVAVGSGGKHSPAYIFALFIFLAEPEN